MRPVRHVIALLPLALVIVIATGCGSGGSGSETKTGTNEFGDPYITNAQAQSVHEGEADTAVFQALGGKAVSGSFAPSPSAPPVIQQAYARNPVDCYDYPLATDRLGNATWEFCFKQGTLVRKSFQPNGSY